MKEKPVRSSTFASNPSHSRLCRYFCSEEDSSLCLSKQKSTIVETPNLPVLKTKPFKRSFFTSKKSRPASAILTSQKIIDDTTQQTVSHARTQSVGDASSITVPTPSLDRSSSTSSTLSSHESFQSDRFVNVVEELSPVTDVDSGSETIWSEPSTYATTVYNSAPVSAVSSPKLSPAESHRKGLFAAKRANTQPAMVIDITSSPKPPSKGLKAAIRNKRETAVLKREAKAIQIWRASTLTLLEAGPDEPTAKELNKVIYLGYSAQITFGEARRALAIIILKPVWWIFFLQSPEKVEKDALMRRFIIHEIYTTEKSYLKNLLIVKTVRMTQSLPLVIARLIMQDQLFFNSPKQKFMDPMVEAAKLGSPLVRSQDLHILFAHLADAIQVSTQIISRFEHYKETSGMLWRQCPLRVGRIFIDLNDGMSCYVKYALDYHSLEKVLKRAVRNVEYQKFNQVGNQ
jgi:hypothetical protein